MKLLLTGASGKLGYRIIEMLKDKYEILALGHRNIIDLDFEPKARIDLTNYSEIESIFLRFSPEIVVHAAAVTSPAISQRLPVESVYGINVKATEKIAGLCARCNSRLIFLSTDLVYDGDKGSYLNEEAPLKPMSVYAESKIEAENILLNGATDFLILRAALMIELSDRRIDNFFDYTYNELKKGESIKLFRDQYRTPIAVFETARIIDELIEKNISNEIINVGGTMRLSRIELGELLCDVGGFSKNLLAGNSIYEAEKIHRVKDVSLDISKLRSYGIEPLNIRESISRLVYGR